MEHLNANIEMGPTGIVTGFCVDGGGRFITTFAAFMVAFGSLTALGRCVGVNGALSLGTNGLAGQSGEYTHRRVRCLRNNQRGRGRCDLHTHTRVNRANVYNTALLHSRDQNAVNKWDFNQLSVELPEKARVLPLTLGQ